MSNIWGEIICSFLRDNVQTSSTHWYLLHQNGKNAILPLFIKNMTSKTLKITNHFPSSQIVAKFLKDLFWINCSVSFWLTLSHDSNLVTLVSISFCKLPAKFYTYFDHGLEVRGASLDIAKTFDKVWHKGLIFILKWFVKCIIWYF